MPFRLGGSTKVGERPGEERLADNEPVDTPLAIEQPLWPRTMPEPNEIDRILAQVFALVGEGIAGATHALLAGDRDAAKQLVKRDEVIDKLIGHISTRPRLRADISAPRPPPPSTTSTTSSMTCTSA